MDCREILSHFLEKNAQLWFNSFNELVGFVISESGDNNFFTFTKRGYECLYGEMLQWVAKNWSNREGTLTTEVAEYQVEYMRALEANGFKQDVQVATTRQYNLQERQNDALLLPDGFQIIDLGTNPDFRAKKLVHNSGFQNKNTVDDFDMLQFEYSRENPAYNPFFDLSVVDANGAHLASCTAFIDWVNNVAEVEKVCTHNEHRRQGFAEAVIRECFNRLKHQGIEYAYITGYGKGANSLYAKLGESKSWKWFNFTLGGMG